MKIRATISLVIISLLFISIFSACGKSEKSMDVGGAASLVENYDTLDKLVSNAVDIAEIKVINQETINYQDVPFTISTVSVLSTLKGSLTNGETIRIIETGGEFVPTDKEGKSLPKQTLKLNGIPVLEKNGHEVIFLRNFVGPQIEGEAYTPLGVYQGRFKVDSSGELIQQAPETGKLKDYKSTKLDEFIEIVKSKNNK